ncbi:hypothetical protein C6P41_001146 [Kluyveromyces marxianus]|nr:hypothetical protein C6P41_001146 [Kluyveromyces marxianus]
MPLITVNYLLFDLDGTLVSSTDAADQTWKEYCEKHGVSYEELSKTVHGTRTAETLAKYFPNVDNTDNKAVKELECSIANNYKELVSLVPGASDLLISLDRPTGSLPGEVFKHRKWAIVTSGTPWVADAWFDHILKSVGKPEVLITANDDDRKDLRTVVFEDAPVGVRAGKASGSIVVALTTTYDKESLFEAGADYVVEDLTQVCVRSNTTASTVLIITDPMERDE